MRVRRLVVIAALMAVSGCTGISRVTQTEVAASYTASEVAYGINNRDLATVVIGEPFDPAGKAVFDRTVTDLLTSATWPPTHYTTTPGPTARRAYHVIIAFNAPASRPAEDLCMGSVSPASVTTPPGHGKPVDVRVQAAFCHGGGALSAAEGVVDGVTGPDAPGFHHLVEDVAHALFPVADFDESGSGCAMGIGC